MMSADEVEERDRKLAAVKVETEGDKFSKYQERRGLAEKEVKEIIFGWAMGEASSEITIQQIRDLAFSVVKAMNRATRDCYDIGNNAK